MCFTNLVGGSGYPCVADFRGLLYLRDAILHFWLGLDDTRKLQEHPESVPTHLDMLKTSSFLVLNPEMLSTGLLCPPAQYHIQAYLNNGPTLQSQI